MVKAKYQNVLDLGEKLKIQNGDVKEENGKLKIWGTANTQYDKTVYGMKLKSLAVKIHRTLKQILK